MLKGLPANRKLKTTKLLPNYALAQTRTCAFAICMLCALLFYLKCIQTKQTKQTISTNKNREKNTLNRTLHYICRLLSLWKHTHTHTKVMRNFWKFNLIKRGWTTHLHRVFSVYAFSHHILASVKTTKFREWINCLVHHIYIASEVLEKVAAVSEYCPMVASGTSHAGSICLLFVFVKVVLFVLKTENTSTKTSIQKSFRSNGCE